MRREEVLSRRRVHPRTRVGGGARQIQVICAANDAVDGGRGRSGALQRGAESSGIVLPPSSGSSMNSEGTYQFGVGFLVSVGDAVGGPAIRRAFFWQVA